MKILRIVCAVLLALPLLFFGSNYFLEFLVIPHQAGDPGSDLLIAMCDGRLMDAIAGSHVLIGILLLVPRTRFLGALLQLPLSIGIVAFHVTMLPAGILVAGIMLLLNLGALAEPSKLRAILGAAPAAAG